MALTVTFSVGAPCAGDAHFPITATPSAGAPITIVRDKVTLRNALSADEKALAFELILRLMISQMSGSTAAAVKTSLEAKTLNLTLTG